LITDAKRYEAGRQLRWPEVGKCPWRESDKVKKRGMHQRTRERQHYHCNACDRDFDDLMNTVFSHHHQPLRKWVLCLYLMGLNLSKEQIAEELDLDKYDVFQMATQLRSGGSQTDA
jgi:transposase-like protein